MVKKWQKIVDKTPNKETIDAAIDKILTGETRGLDITSISGRENHYRCRIGKFRIIFYGDKNNKHYIIGAGYRGDIYKNI